MSVHKIDSFVVLFPNPEWSNDDTERGYDSTVIQLKPNISFAQHLNGNIQTISIPSASIGIGSRGLLYVPDIDHDDTCYASSVQFIPQNVTRQANLPAIDFTLIALAPLISSECTRKYLDAARKNPTRAFIFYIPDDGVTTTSSSADYWDLGDGGKWKDTYEYPVYRISGSAGRLLMSQLSLYSGNMTDIPNGHQIASSPGIDPRDYVRIFTKVGGTSPTVFPSIWIFLLVVAGSLAFMLLIISAMMHWIQHRRRQSLRQRVASGKVNLEALGIKRVTVPLEFIERLPLFIYNSEGEKKAPPLLQLEDNGVIDLESNGCSGTTLRPSTLSADSTLSPRAMSYATSTEDYIFFHKFLPYSQPVCAICLEGFEGGITVIREIPCGHIYHPECIDIYLENSSLCPLCKQSVLPVGYCPKITNAMVRREIRIRKLQTRVMIHPQNGQVETSDPSQVVWDFGRRFVRAVFSTGRGDPDDEDDISVRRPQQLLPFMAPLPEPGTADLRSKPRDRTRQEVIEQRIHELAVRQNPIRDPDLDRLVIRSKWKRSLSKVFPGFV